METFHEYQKKVIFFDRFGYPHLELLIQQV